MPEVIVVMGVSGCGKSTVGPLLADRLNLPYLDADSVHTPDSIAKMAGGVALDDADRIPWLDSVGTWLHEQTTGGVVSCSALKRAYRDHLRRLEPGVFFVHLVGDGDLIADRLAARRGHYMPPTLLASQFAALEPLEPDEAGAVVAVDSDPSSVVEGALVAVAASGS